LRDSGTAHFQIATGNLSLENIVPLTLMASGEAGIVIQVDGSADVVHRLAEKKKRNKRTMKYSKKFSEDKKKE